MEIKPTAKLEAHHRDFEDPRIGYAKRHNLLDRQQNFQHNPFTYAKQINKSLGRLEIRQCWAISDAEYLLICAKGLTGQC